MLCSAWLCAVRMIQVARQEGLNVEQNAAEILVEQVRFTNPFTLILPYPTLPYPTQPYPAMPCPALRDLSPPLHVHSFSIIYSPLSFLSPHQVVSAHISRRTTAYSLPPTQPLPYLTLPYLTLPYLTLPNRHSGGQRHQTGAARNADVEGQESSHGLRGAQERHEAHRKG